MQNLFALDEVVPVGVAGIVEDGNRIVLAIRVARREGAAVPLAVDLIGKPHHGVLRSASAPTPIVYACYRAIRLFPVFPHRRFLHASLYWYRNGDLNHS